MWEVLRPKFVIHYSTALHLIEPLSSVMAIRDQVRINNKVFCAPCVQCSGLEFNKSLEYGHLAPPLDNLYVFDKTYSWYIAITSEYERHNFWGDTEDSLDYLCFASCNPFRFADFVKT